MTSPATTQDPTLNTVTWWEIPVADLDEAARFYPAVFGWRVAPFGEGFLAVHARDAMIGGLFTSPEPPTGGVQLYVAVPDIERTLVAATAAGGSIVQPRTFIAEGMGWWAEIADPSGRRLGICSAQDTAA